MESELWRGRGASRSARAHPLRERALAEASALAAQGGPPLSGTEHVYRVAQPAPLKEWYLRVASPIHNPEDVFVRDGDKRDVWLNRK
jgi:hypothetical protein